MQISPSYFGSLELFKKLSRASMSFRFFSIVSQHFIISGAQNLFTLAAQLIADELLHLRIVQVRWPAVSLPINLMMLITEWLSGRLG